MRFAKFKGPETWAFDFSSRVINIVYNGNNPVFNTYFHWRFIMKDYYENKIAHLEEQIENLEFRIDGIKYRIEFYQKKLKKFEGVEAFFKEEINEINMNLKRLGDKMYSHNRAIAELTEEIHNVRNQQKNQYRTVCSADEGYDELDIMLIIGRNGFIGGTRL